MKYPIRFCLILLCGLWVACTDNSFDESHLVGAWKLRSWTIDASGHHRPNKMDMTFYDDGTYVIDYISERERGKYWVANDFLHTVETGRAEKKVLIQQLSLDSLKIQMNRAGQLETVILLKEKE